MTNIERCRSLRLSFLSVLWLCSLPALAQYSSNIQGVVSDPVGPRSTVPRFDYVMSTPESLP